MVLYHIVLSHLFRLVLSLLSCKFYVLAQVSITDTQQLFPKVILFSSVSDITYFSLVSKSCKSDTWRLGQKMGWDLFAAQQHCAAKHSSGTHYSILRVLVHSCLIRKKKGLIILAEFTLGYFSYSIWSKHQKNIVRWNIYFFALVWSINFVASCTN